MFYLDPQYLLMVVLPSLVLVGGAQLFVKSTFARYSQVRTSSGHSGAQVARRLLDRAGLSDVAIEEIPGELSDHYDPRSRVLRLSSPVARGQSVAAAGVAAHETGHAMQHATGYAPLAFRNGLVPVANFGSGLGPVMIILGFFTRFSGLITLGILLFAGAVLFQLITLPVELNASRRAVAVLAESGEVSRTEEGPVRTVLTAAALTYLAAALAAILQLLYFIGLGRRD
jgi:hypothetical protein